MARSSELDGALSFVETGVYEDSVRSSPRLRALIRASAEEAERAVPRPRSCRAARQAASRHVCPCL